MRKFNSKLNLSLLLASVILLTFIWPSQIALTITDGKTAELLYASPLRTGDRFAIQFIHSIHRTPVYEEYYIDNQFNMILDRVIYESYGVGNPSTLEPGQTFKQENGKYIIGNVNRKFPYFDLSIGQVIANHQLMIKDQWIPLASLQPSGKLIRVQIKKISFLTLWKGEVVNGK